MHKLPCQVNEQVMTSVSAASFQEAAYFSVQGPSRTNFLYTVTMTTQLYFNINIEYKPTTFSELYRQYLAIG